MTGAAVPGQLPDGPALTMCHCVLSGVVEGGDHRAGHPRPAGRARLREVINSWLEETSFRAVLTASATALVLIGAAVTFALLTSGHGAAGGPRHGARRGPQRSGRHGSTAGRGAGLVAAATCDRGPVSVPGDAGPGSCVPGCEPCCVCDESRPGCSQLPARLPARPRARQASSLLSPRPARSAGPGRTPLPGRTRAKPEGA